MSLTKTVACSCCAQPAQKWKHLRAAKCDRCQLLGCQPGRATPCKNILKPGETVRVIAGTCKCCGVEIAIDHGNRHQYHISNSRKNYRKWCDRCRNLNCPDYLKRGRTEPLCRTNGKPNTYQKRGITRAQDIARRTISLAS